MSWNYDSDDSGHEVAYQSYQWENYPYYVEDDGGVGSSTGINPRRPASSSRAPRRTNAKPMSRNVGASSRASSTSQARAQDITGGDADANADVSEFDDYFCALMLQMSLIEEDRETGNLGKVNMESDTQIAIEHMLREAEEMERSYRLAKSLATCGAVPEELFEEMDLQDATSFADRELAERLVIGDASAELSLNEASSRFRLMLLFFTATAECCACNSRKKTYTAPCGHDYCEGCAQSLYQHALMNRSFIPVRCCKIAFAPEIASVGLDNTDDVERYNTIRNEIENPCPPAPELDVAASGLITERGWKVCPRCGAVVEKVSGCVHITCMCRNEFCYTCLKVWRTCDCELYPEEEIRQILDERVGNGDPGAARHRLQNVLRNYYQHEHNWKQEVPNGRVCSVCRTTPLYCMHCEVCMETRCHRCCYNN
ncbi:hypothetical protein BGX21_009271 [Mortierella sp. AD011]|nr:hypothetical protein BGX20_009275 [Mortierella sp. AD010]KAF9397092.1 hypothetical protein BGX21_009271 [Mortierella sp. AD011]